MSLATTLDKRVTLQAPPSGRDDTGAALPGWTNVITDGDGKLWAGIADLTGREFIAAGAEQAAVQTKITIRYRTGVTAAMRVLHGADVYRIEAVLGQAGRTLLLMCSRGVA